MVKEKHKPDDSDYREEEEAMLREMVKNDYIERGDDYIRFGQPRASRIFLVEELDVDDINEIKGGLNSGYPEDVEEKPDLVKEKYKNYKSTR